MAIIYTYYLNFPPRAMPLIPAYIFLLCKEPRIVQVSCRQRFLIIGRTLLWWRHNSRSYKLVSLHGGGSPACAVLPEHSSCKCCRSHRLPTLRSHLCPLSSGAIHKTDPRVCIFWMVRRRGWHTVGVTAALGAYETCSACSQNQTIAGHTLIKCNSNFFFF